MQIGLGQGIVLDGDPAPPKRAQPPMFGPCLLWHNGWMDAIGTEVGLGPRDIVLDGDPAPPTPNKKGHSLQFSANVCCGQVVAHLSNC